MICFQDMMDILGSYLWATTSFYLIRIRVLQYTLFYFGTLCLDCFCFVFKNLSLYIYNIHLKISLSAIGLPGALPNGLLVCDPSHESANSEFVFVFWFGLALFTFPLIESFSFYF